MSSIDIYKVLAEFQGAWERLEREGIYDHLSKSARCIIEPIVEHLREAEKSGYLGTLYRTDYEVEGEGRFRSTCFATRHRGPRKKATREHRGFVRLSDLRCAKSG